MWTPDLWIAVLEKKKIRISRSFEVKKANLVSVRIRIHVTVVRILKRGYDLFGTCKRAAKSSVIKFCVDPVSIMARKRRGLVLQSRTFTTIVRMISILVKVSSVNDLIQPEFSQVDE